MGHVGAPHGFAQLARNRSVVKSNERVADVRCPVDDRDDLKVAHTDEDDEDQTAGQHEHKERIAQTLILPEANERFVVEQFSEFWQQVRASYGSVLCLMRLTNDNIQPRPHERPANIR